MKNFNLPITIKNIYSDILIIGLDSTDPAACRLISELKTSEEYKQKFQFREVYFDRMDIEACSCNYECIRSGGKYCPVRDYRDKLEELILHSEGIIFLFLSAKPVPPSWENLVRRFENIRHRPRFFKQKAVLLCNGVIKVRDILSTISAWGINVYRADKLDRMKKKLHKEYGDSAAGDFVDDFLKHLFDIPPYRPGFMELLGYQIRKNRVIKDREKIPADYKYWTENNWLESIYYYPVEPGKWKKKGIDAFSFILKSINRIQNLKNKKNSGQEE